MQAVGLESACRSCWHANPAQAEAGREGAWRLTGGAADTEPAHSTPQNLPYRHTYPPLLFECKFQEGAGVTQLCLL